mgnify:CR=1 FL=1
MFAKFSPRSSTYIRRRALAYVDDVDIRPRSSAYADLRYVDAWQCVESDRFCASYINSYIANGAVIMPSYGLPGDDRAKAVYQKLFPQREVVSLRIDNIAPGGGGIHCITQQQPDRNAS